MDDSTRLELLPDYALGLLSADEQKAVEELLTRSETARYLLAEYEAMLGGLALLAPARTAPAHLTDDFAVRLQKADTQPIHLAHHRADERRAVRPLLARSLLLVAAVLVLVVGAALAFRAWQQQTEVNIIASILNNPAAQQTPLTFSDPTMNGRVVFYSLNDKQEAVLDVQQMPPPPTGKQYQLWLIDAQSPKPLNVFNGTPGASMQLLIHAADKIASYKVVAITIEPEGGSQAPTSKPIAAGQF